MIEKPSGHLNVLLVPGAIGKTILSFLRLLQIGQRSPAVVHRLEHPDRLGVRRHDVQHDLQPVDPALEIDQEVAVPIPPLTFPSLIEPGAEEGPGVSQPLLGPGLGVDGGPPGQNRGAEKVFIFVADGQLVMGCAADLVFFELGRLVPHFFIAKLLKLRNQLAKQDEGRRQPLLAVDHLEVIEGPQTCPRLLVRLLQQDGAEVVIAVVEVVEIVPQIPEVLLFPGVAALVDGDLEEPVAREELVQRCQESIPKLVETRVTSGRSGCGMSLAIGMDDPEFLLNRGTERREVAIAE